jgi:hypothetical protein
MLFALDKLNLATQDELEPGSLFQTASRHTLGGLCMRAVLAAHKVRVSLAGDNKFQIDPLRESDTAIPVVFHSLHLRFDASQSDNAHPWEVGCLTVSDTRVTVAAFVASYGGTSQTYLLNLRDGTLNSEDPTRYTCFKNWRLVDRDEHGKETILCTAGDMG